MKERAVTDIRATAESHTDIAYALLAIHGLSGTDAVASFHGTCKATVAKVALVLCMLILTLLRLNPLTRSQTEDECENTIEDPEDNVM